MGDININESVAITISSTSVDNKVLRYSRDQQICTGIGTCSIAMVDDGTDYDPWDVIVINEDGNKVGTFYVSTVTRDLASGVITIEGQDGSKKLADFFIDESYTVTAENNQSSYWLAKFLDDAGVNYSFIGSLARNSIINVNSSLGLTSAYDAVIQLLQYMGAYMYFDPNGTAKIGSMRLDGGSVEVDDTRILSIKNTVHDQMLRNRAVVWGNSDPETGQWIIADLSTVTPWNYDSRDQRAVVLANSNIGTVEDAQSLARMMLDEFAHINNEFTVEIEGFIDAHVGSRFRASSDFSRASGMITTFTVDITDRGAITTVVLNEKCPRLFAYYDEPIPGEDYVYVGTDGSGVWRKALNGTTWEDFSVGLSGSSITDLYINEDLFVCVEASGVAFSRYLGTSWTQLVPSGVMDATTSGIVQTESMLAKACTINHLTNTPIVGYNSDVTYSGGWVVVYSGSGGVANATQVYVSVSGEANNYSLAVFDVDTSDQCNIVSVVTTSGTTEIIFEPDDLGGYRTGEASTFLTRINPHAAVTLPRENGRTFTYFDVYDWYGIIDGPDPIGATSPVEAYLTVHEGLPSTYIYYLQTNDSLYNSFSVTRNKLIGPSYTTWSGSTVGGDATFVFDEPPLGLYKENDVYYRIYAGFGYCGLGQASGGSYVIDFNEGTCSLVGRFDKNYGNMISLASLMHEKYIWVLYIKDHVWPENYEDNIGLLKYDVTAGAGEEIDMGSFDWNDDYRYGTDYKFNISPMGEDGVIIAGAYVRQRPTILGAYFQDEVGYFFGTDSTGLTRRVLYDGSAEGWEPYANVSIDPELGTQAGIGWLGEDITGSAKYISMSWEQRFQDTGNLDADLEEHTLYVYITSNGTSEVWDNAPYYVGAATSSKYVSAPYTIGFDDPMLYFYDKSTATIAMQRDISELAAYKPSYLYSYMMLQSPLDDLYDCIYIGNPSTTMCFSINNFYQGELDHFYQYTEMSYPTATLSNLFLCYYEQGELQWYFFYPTHFEYFTREVPVYNGYLLRQDGDTFTVIFSGSVGLNLDISNQAPLEAFTTTSGSPIFGANENIYESFLMQPDSFGNIDTTYSLYDLRTVRFTSSGLTVASGIMDSVDGQYAVVASMEAIKGFPTSLSGSSITFTTLSGLVSHVETSRLQYDPYIFASISGDGGYGSTFYQRNPGTALTGFVDQTYNFPSGCYITTIRMDDRM